MAVSTNASVTAALVAVLSIHFSSTLAESSGEIIRNCMAEAKDAGLAGDPFKESFESCVKQKAPEVYAQKTTIGPQVTQDRFEGTTKIISGAPQSDGTPSLTFLAVLKGKRITELDLSANSHTEGWRYLKCRSMHWLVDGKPFAMPTGEYDGSVGDAGYVFEYFYISPSLATYKRLAKAESIEYKICNDEVAVSEEGLQNLRDFVGELARRTAK